MCIIQGPVHSVANTNILVAPCEGGQTQLTVYSNKVSLQKASGAMICSKSSRTCFLDLAAATVTVVTAI